MSIGLYTVDIRYIEHLSVAAPHLFFEKKTTGAHPRKYVGIVLEINNFQYFAPLTSFKSKHKRLANSVDFLKIDSIAAINLNLMFPVPENTYYQVIHKMNKTNSTGT